MLDLFNTLIDSIKSNLSAIILALLFWLAVMGRKALYNLFVNWFPVGFKIRGKATQTHVSNGVELHVTLWINKRTPETEIIEKVDAYVGGQPLNLGLNPPWKAPPKGTSVISACFVGLVPGNYSGQILTITMTSRNRRDKKAISVSCLIS